MDDVFCLPEKTKSLCPEGVMCLCFCKNLRQHDNVLARLLSLRLPRKGRKTTACQVFSALVPKATKRLTMCFAAL
jgi:hypothetical protein